MNPQHFEQSEHCVASELSAATGGAAPTVDRRRNERRSHRLSVKLLSSRIGEEPVSFVGLTENLSEGGAFVATRAPWEIGATFEVIIGLSREQFFHAKARIRWRRFAWSENGQAPGIGIRFERISPADAERIREFASRA
jgi:Tfp pilus assembly protein PilZ